MRPLAPVRVRCESFIAGYVDWRATCRICADYLTTDEHREALAWAHGHMHVRHPGWSAGVACDCPHPLIAGCDHDDGALARVAALVDEWEQAAQKPRPERAETESAQDQGVRIGVWHSVRVAAGELRAALWGHP